MQFPESWLRQFCNPPLSSAELCHTLTMAGLEVEQAAAVAPPCKQVVVAEIKSVAPHPNAQRLQVCQVDVGQPDYLSIVCGAPNARAGIKVPCALIGAELSLPDGARQLIKLGRLRGVDSFGMLCSARELGLPDEYQGLLELAADAPLGQDIRQHLNLDDMLLTLKLTPNLAHCLSVYGVARELSALTGAPLHKPVVAASAVTCEQLLPVLIEAPDLCGRFSGRIISGLNPNAATPAWLVQRLARCGQRSVTALVDISNYVMFELGQPSHIFDLDQIDGGLQVRWARPGEQLTLLNGNTVTLDDQVGVIADARQLESLAGIMGGQASAVSKQTQNIYLEAAFWWPKAIAGRARRFNFATDASHRFERGVDPELTLTCIERMTQLIVDICGTPETRCGPLDDHRTAMPKPVALRLRLARVTKVLGVALSLEACRQALLGLGLQVESQDDEALWVLAPSYRFDIQVEEDLIEEIARVFGYDKLPARPMQAPVVLKRAPESRRSEFVLRRLMAAFGYQETINFSFVDERWERELAGNLDPVRLLNPIASQMSVMRSSLLGSLLGVLKFNQDRKVSRLRLFEIGRVFWRDPAVPDSDTTVAGFQQPLRLAALAAGAVDMPDWGGLARPVDFFDIKGDLESLLAPKRPSFLASSHPALHPGRSARLVLDGVEIGVVGELHPKWCQSYELSLTPVLFELDLPALLQRELPCFAPVAKFQPVQRDIAVLLPESVSHDALMAAIWAAPAAAQVLSEAVLFDIYRPQSATDAAIHQAEKSMAVRLTLNAAGVNMLTEAQIDAAVASVLATLSQQLGARQR